MADELNQQKAFLTSEESAAVLQTDARQGMARAQRLLAMRYLRGRGVPKDEAIAFYWMQAARRTTTFCHGTAQSGRALQKRLGYCAGHNDSVSLVWSRSTARRFHRQKTFATLKLQGQTPLKDEIIQLDIVGFSL